MGEKKYILEELTEKVGDFQKGSGAYSNEVMYWINYTYRCCVYYTREGSAAIYRIALNETMATGYLGLHTLDIAMAIDRLKEC